jgi:serine-type D-Ala-D-Ala carboxypeptidase/endopeptidase (penicillin-binding protein 4)
VPANSFCAAAPRRSQVAEDCLIKLFSDEINSSGRDQQQRGWLVAKTWQVAASAGAAGLALALVCVAAAGPWEGGQRAAERGTARARKAARHHEAAEPQAPPVLVPLAIRTGTKGAPPQALPTGRGLQRALGPLLGSGNLGTAHSAAVLDAVTGAVLYGNRAQAPATPASTIKLATAFAALTALGPEHRISTEVVQGGRSDEIVLVGGGDPTLTARALPTGPEHPASLRQLARDTASTLKARGTTRVRLRYDTSAYTGPVHHPIGAGNDNIAPVTALMADEGRVDPRSTGYAARWADPAAEAARAFAGFLRRDGIRVPGAPAPGRARHASEASLAEVRSPDLASLVERMLTTSDNDIAEALARQTAMASGRPASFAGAARATTGVLRSAHLPLRRVAIHDGSGLNRADRVSAELLARVLATAAAPGRPELRPILTGLPVAGFTGTLRARYGGASPARGAAGLVRAKTGTLTGVNTLAGILVDADGRLLTFAFTAQGTTVPARATATLDRLAAAVARCGCH